MPSSMVLFPFSCLYSDKPMFTLVPRVYFVQDSLRSIKWSLLVKDIIALIQCIISILIQLMLSFLRLFHSFLMTVRKPHYWVFLFLSLYLVLEVKRYSQFLNHYNYILKDQRYRHLLIATNPESSAEVPIHQPQSSMSEVATSYVLDNHAPSDLDLPIALRKGKRSITTHPIACFVLYDYFTSFFVNLPCLYLMCLYPENQETIKNPSWK